MDGARPLRREADIGQACGESNVCARLVRGVACVPSCTTDGDCRDRYQCRDVEGVKFCDVKF